MRKDDPYWERPFPFERHRNTRLEVVPADKLHRRLNKRSLNAFIYDAVLRGATTFPQIVSELEFCWSHRSTNNIAWRTDLKLKEMQAKGQIKIIENGTQPGTVVPCAGLPSNNE